MVVALGARERDAHENRGRRVHAVDHVGGAVFIFLLARLAVGGVIAVEAGGDLLRERRVGKEIARELLDRELIERHVRVEGVDDPLAPFPDLAGHVVLVAARVRVPGEVEPLLRLALAEALRLQEAIHLRLVGVGTLVRQELVDLRGGRREPGEVEAGAAKPRFAGRFRLPA